MSPIINPGGGGGGGGGGSGTVTSVTSADTSIVVTNATTAASLQVSTLDVIATNEPPAADWSNNGKKITSLKDGTSAQDAATINNLNAVAAGLQFKAAVRLATTAALPTNVYANGASGVGATLTGVAFGALSIDGTVVVVGDRVLIKNEAAPANNGIYVVTTVGAVATLYVLTRAADYNQTSEIQAGDVVFTTAGSTLSDTSWLMTTTGAITVGTTAIAWSQFGTGAVSSVFSRTGAVVAAANDYSEAQISFTNITTNDVSTTKHGYAPKAPNDATKYLDGTGAYSVPSGGGTQGTEIGYDAITSAVSITATTNTTANVVISCAAHTFDGSPVLLQVYFPDWQTSGFGGAFLFEAGTNLGTLALRQTGRSESSSFLRFTPSAGSHTYTINALDTSGGGTITCGSGTIGVEYPAFARFTKV